MKKKRKKKNLSYFLTKINKVEEKIFKEVMRKNMRNKQQNKESWEIY